MIRHLVYIVFIRILGNHILNIVNKNIMEMKFNFVKTCLFFLFSFVLQYNSLEAQTDAVNQLSQADNKITYCDDFITETKVALEKRANKDCKTMKHTISCQDKKSGMDVHVILIVQPSSKHGCPNKVSIAEDKVAYPMSRGGIADFTVEVLQEPCSRGGSTLTAYVPGEDGFEKIKKYAYNWFDGGQLISTERTVSCVTSESISLKVMKVANGQFVKRSITLDSANPVTRDDYKVAGYEKTACYGTCPVYKVAIHKDGKAIWDGVANTEKMGKWEASVNEKMLKAIKDAAFEKGYFDLYNKYPYDAEIADATKTITYVRVGDMIKSVANTVGGPDNLVEFENLLVKIIDTLEWKEVDNRQKTMDKEPSKN